MCYSNCHNVKNLPIKEVTCVDEWNHIGNERVWHFETSKHLVHLTLDTINDVHWLSQLVLVTIQSYTVE